MNDLTAITLTGFALCSVGLSAQKKESVAPPRNIILINADDVGIGDFSYSGHSTVSTPNVDFLAKNGVQLNNLHSTSATSTPSRFSMLTGIYAWRVEGTGIATGDAAMIITPDMQTLPQMLQRAGYRTAAIGKWHLGIGDKTGEQDWNGTITPGLSDIGFDYSYIMAATGDRVPCVYIENGKTANHDPAAPIQVSYTTPFPGEPLGSTHPQYLKLSPSHGHDMAIINGISRIGYMKGGGKALWKDEDIADRIVEKSTNFIESNKARPFFLYMATNDVHVPRAPHARFVGKSKLGARGDALLSFDWSVGKIINKLRELNLLHNTLIIITSDNGPVVDDGYQDKAWERLGKHRPWGNRRSGKYSIYEGGTNVPGIVYWPNTIHNPTKSNALLSQIDLYASLAALVKAPLSKDEAPDSQDQLTSFLGKEKKGRSSMIEHNGTFSVVKDGWKYIHPHNGDLIVNQWVRNETGYLPTPQLYNLRRDPNEQNNLASRYPERIKALQQILTDEQNKTKQLNQKQWKLIFEDHFNPIDGEIDSSKWSHCARSQSHWAKYMTNDSRTAYIHDGKLILRTLKYTHSDDTAHYHTGGVETRGKFDFCYGKVEICARLGKGNGSWPAIWLMPTSQTNGWPKDGEINIMQQLNFDPVFFQTIHNEYHNLLYNEYPRKANTCHYNVDAFNTYGLEWYPNRIDFTYNGKITFRYLRLVSDYGNQWPFNKPFYLILNQSAGGEWTGPINDKHLPYAMDVDWVRVWQEHSTPH